MAVCERKVSNVTIGQEGKTSLYISHYQTHVTKNVTTNCQDKNAATTNCHNSLLQQIRAK